jgi:hypothetical protein
MEDPLGACWSDQSIELKSMNVVFCNGELEPRIVIKQEGGMVTMVKTTNSQDPENPVNHCSLGHRPSTRIPWNVNESDDMSHEETAKAAAEGSTPGAALLKNGGSKAGSTVWMVFDEKLEILPRNQICRAAGELFEKRHFLNWNKPQIGNLHDGKRGTAPSAFLRVYEHPMSTGRRVYMSEERSFRSGEPKSMFDPYDSETAGEGNDQLEVDGSSDMESQVAKWRAQAAAISDSAGILAGGDGSARKKKGVINGAYG